MKLRRKAALGAASLIGLLFAAAGMMSAVTAIEHLPARLVLDLPDWLGIPFIVLACLATLFIVLLLGPAVRPRELQEARRRAVMAQILLLATILLLVGLRQRMGVDFDDVARRLAELGGPPQSLTVSEGEQPPAGQSALVNGVMEALLVALALIAFGVMAWVGLAFLPARGGRAVAPAFDSPALRSAIEESLDDLRHLPDARLAIIRCYDRFERVLATADVRRPPWQTVLEFMRTVLKYPRLPDSDVRELTGLFEIARFSRHDLGPEHRERAWQALVAVKAALEEDESHGPAS